ncbi:hypothetical protein OL548_19765 [Lysinibacillus sp. MHQ-1]|nr:hypothetical protein OL548_19765 [Lysinibacillus sp. MHQ-1]
MLNSMLVSGPTHKTKSIAVVGPIGSGKTVQLSTFAEKLISQGKKKCVIEVKEYSEIPNRMNVDQNIVTYFDPVQDEFPGEVKQLMFFTGSSDCYSKW